MQPFPCRICQQGKAGASRNERHSEADYEHPGFFAPGNQSSLLFNIEQEDEETQYAFEVCIIFAGPHTTIVPQSDQSLNPKCPQCQAGVGTQLNALYCPDEETMVDDIDFTNLTLTCPQCHGVFRPDDLIDELGIFLTKRFINFDAPFGPLRPEWLAEFSGQVGCSHHSHTYWYT